MRITEVTANNRRKAFEVVIGRRRLLFPYPQLRIQPNRSNRVTKVWVDDELGSEAFTYILQNGDQDTVHLDQVLDYNSDPAYLHDLVLYQLTLEAERAVAVSELSKREIIRRLGTSASQFYRLLDQTNYTKSVGQLLTLLNVLGWHVEFVVSRKRPMRAEPHKTRSKRRRDRVVGH